MHRGNDKAMRNARAAVGLLAGGLLVAGCSSSQIDGADSPTFTSKISNLFSSAPKDGAVRTAAGEPAEPDITCPGVDIRQGTSTLSIAATKGNAPATAGDLRYQLSFSQFARECIVQPGTMTIKIGVQGRVIVGPAGGAGQVEIPLRYAVVREGPEPKTIATRFKKTQITVAQGDANLPFTDIDEGLSFPMPSRSELDAYIIYVGFDPIGEKPERKSPKTSKKSAR